MAPRKMFLCIVLVLFVVQAGGVVLLAEKDDSILMQLMMPFTFLMGVLGIAVVAYTSVAAQDRDSFKEKCKDWRGTAQELGWFINTVAPIERIAEVFRIKQHSFDAMSKAQVRFYQKRDAGLARIAKEHPDDAEMPEYHEKLRGSEAEETRLKLQVSTKKSEFWYLHRIVGKVNQFLDQHMSDPVAFDCPDSIKDMAEEPIGDKGGTGW